jgi:hypothetical protein
MKTSDIKNIIVNLKASLRERWHFYQHAAYLKNKGWTEEEYQNYEDPDRNVRATRVKDYYRGYPHTVVFESSRGDPWTRYDSWIDAYSAIQEWCKENNQEKWRSDILRVFKAPSTNNEWELNDIGGGDALFFAFKNVNDAFVFKLKWGGE